METLGLIIIVVLALLLAFFLNWLILKGVSGSNMQDSPQEGMCCRNCRNRYPMNEEDLKHFPCKSKHRCSTDGTIIPDLSYWCPDYEKEKTNGA